MSNDFNDSIEFNIFVNNKDTGKIEIHKVEIDLDKFLQFKKQIYNFHHRKGPIKERNNITDLMNKYDLGKTEVVIGPKYYIGSSDEDGIDIYDFEYYTYDIEGKKIISILNSIIKDTNDIIQETINMKQLINWECTYEQRSLTEKNLINGFLAPIKITPVNIDKLSNNELLNMLRKFKSFIEAYNEYNSSMKPILDANKEHAIRELEKAISTDYDIDFKFSQFVKPIITPIAKQKLKKSYTKRYVPSTWRINRKCNQ